MKCNIIFHKLCKTGCCFTNMWILVYKLASMRVMGTSMGVGTFGLCPMPIWGYYWEKG